MPLRAASTYFLDEHMWDLHLKETSVVNTPSTKPLVFAFSPAETAQKQGTLPHGSDISEAAAKCRSHAPRESLHLPPEIRDAIYSCVIATSKSTAYNDCEQVLPMTFQIQNYTSVRFLIHSCN